MHTPVFQFHEKVKSEIDRVCKRTRGAQNEANFEHFSTLVVERFFSRFNKITGTFKEDHLKNMKKSFDKTTQLLKSVENKKSSLLKTEKYFHTKINFAFKITMQVRH